MNPKSPEEAGGADLERSQSESSSLFPRAATLRTLALITGPLALVSAAILMTNVDGLFVDRPGGWSIARRVVFTAWAALWTFVWTWLTHRFWNVDR